ncbi:MAG: hypothetical protein HN337_10165 [Deltaproteobacteria bacterium]|jgi:hypothetical protein|nr:hypothetical protein [Deltaproteobacteria bacterium]
MRNLSIIAVVLMAAFLITSQALANGTVDISGDITKNQCLTIDVDWTADTSTFSGMDLSKARDRMYDKMWEKILPKLVAKTRGYPIAYDDSQFVLINENTKLLNERADGSFVYNVKLKMKFACGRRPSNAKPMRRHSQAQMDKEFKYRFQSVVQH